MVLQFCQMVEPPVLPCLQLAETSPVFLVAGGHHSVVDSEATAYVQYSLGRLHNLQWRSQNMVEFVAMFVSSKPLSVYPSICLSF